jgi:hypothetical protein
MRDGCRRSPWISALDPGDRITLIDVPIDIGEGLSVAVYDPEASSFLQWSMVVVAGGTNGKPSAGGRHNEIKVLG